MALPPRQNVWRGGSFLGPLQGGSIATFQIHLITDRKAARGDVPAAVGAALRGGADWVQLREKNGPALELYETAEAVIPQARRAGAGVLINDRLDVALATGADGAHLAGKSLPPSVARELLPDGILGASVHSLEEAKRAEAAGVDYVTFGHVYPTSSKPGMKPRGVIELAEIVESVEIPVIAIGGIDASNVREVLETGASGIAVISAIIAASDPASAARTLRRAVDDCSSRPRYALPEPSRKGAR